MLFSRNAQLKNVRALYNGSVVFYHTDLRVCNKKDQGLVPKQFLKLMETKSSQNSSRRKTGEKYYTERVKNVNISKKEYLFGISPCLAALEARRRKFYSIYLNDDASNTKSRPQFEDLERISARRNIPIKLVSRKRLDDLSGNRPHQNIVIKVENLSMVPLSEKFDSDSTTENINGSRPSIWLILEGIQDPMNMGAILRTAAFLGVDKVVSSEFDSCALTPTVSKASAGAMESLPVYTTNIKHLLKEKGKENYDIVGTVGANFVSTERTLPVVTINNLKLEKPLLLVLGNEGKGLSKEIQNLCTKFLTIPSKKYKKMSHLDSLNVSVATGIILHSLLNG
ncbi:rRNA methyltransferase 1, mitochondrial-like [Dendronephthya gigantea]|uniref:rRNA methyltransferase 1, mitochondrial-like n=1 Tax=Dendronephthya gigantea TaxID=151771 RepID=UPI00106CD5CF|nr:rRNA methyltransferase 1, mitochondrial-like [Dendronephthya gigantea]